MDFCFSLTGKEQGKYFWFLISGPKIPEEIITAIEPFRDIFSFEIIPFTRQTEALYDRFGIKGNGYYLIRPDLYLAYRSNKHITEHLVKYLSGFFVIIRPGIFSGMILFFPNCIPLTSARPSSFPFITY